jgi:hypothetical protein
MAEQEREAHGKPEAERYHAEYVPLPGGEEGAAERGPDGGTGAGEESLWQAHVHTADLDGALDVVRRWATRGAVSRVFVRHLAVPYVEILVELGRWHDLAGFVEQLEPILSRAAQPDPRARTH